MSRKMKLIFSTELYKLCKRKDTWILLSVLLVPALYAIGIVSGSDIVSYSGTGNITAINFVSAMFQMSQSMFIFNVILAAIAARTLGTELEDKSFLLYLNRVGSRKQIYIGKMLSLIIYNFFVDVLLIFVSLLFYYLVLSGRTDIVSGIFADENAFLEIVQIGVICGFWILTTLFTMMLSVKYRMVVCLGIYMIGYVAMNLISYAAIIRYVSPLYYITRSTFANKVMITDIVKFILYFVLTSSVVSHLGQRKLEIKDL